MNPRKPSRKLIRSLCAEVHPDDGVDPRELARQGRDRSGHQTKTHRKSRQLCHQIAETLRLVLASQPDEVLQSLAVHCVEPAPDTTRLLVTVGVEPALGTTVDPIDALERLDRASGRIRSEVAAAITRRRTPVLSFRFAIAT